MNTRIRNIIGYASRGDGRSYGGGLADYGDEEIREAIEQVQSRGRIVQALRRELDARATTLELWRRWESGEEPGSAKRELERRGALADYVAAQAAGAGLETRPGRCIYCELPLTSNEYDHESGGYFSSHFRCVSPVRDGAFYLESYYRGQSRGPGGDFGYTTLRRAKAKAAQLAAVNSDCWDFHVYDREHDSPRATFTGERRSRIAELERAAQELEQAAPDGLVL